MKVEIIAVGTELLMGQVIDSNSAYIAQELLNIGLGVYYRQVVGDNPQRILEALDLAASRSELIILCGGIGPTEDDITKQMVADYLNIGLVEDKAQVEKIKQYFKQTGPPMPENNLRQALIFEHGIKLENPAGSAAGTLYEKNNQLFAVLPGPPQELQATLNDSLIPYLEQVVDNKQIIHSSYLNFVNIGESQLAADIADLVDTQTNPSIAIYAKPDRVQVRLTSNAAVKEEAIKLNEALSKVVIQRLSSYFIGIGKDFCLANELIEHLQKEGLTISCAESITGGLFASELVSQKGASKVFKGGIVSYSSQSKEKLLNVNPQLIDNYSVYSSQVALAMAQGAMDQYNTDISVSFTGVAGPQSDQSHPAGEVFYAILEKNKQPILGKLMLGQRPRNMIRYLSVQRVLARLVKHLK